MATIFPTEGQPIEIGPANNRFFQLGELQAMVNGHMEYAHLTDGSQSVLVFCDEPGVMRRPINKTIPLHIPTLAVGYTLHGPIVHLSKAEWADFQAKADLPEDPPAPEPPITLTLTTTYPVWRMLVEHLESEQKWDDDQPEGDQRSDELAEAIESARSWIDKAVPFREPADDR